MNGNRAPLWPAVDTGLPEPLASCFQAYVLADLNAVTLTRGARTNRLLDDATRWPDLLREQLTRVVRGEDDLPRRMLEHLQRIGYRGRWLPLDPENPSPATADTVTRVVINLAARFGGPVPVEGTYDTGLTEEQTLRRWAGEQPPSVTFSKDPATASDLLGLRLAMGELDAVAEVLGRARGGRLRTFTRAPVGAAATERTALDLDLDRLAVAYPHLDPERLSLHVEMALWKRHLFGVLDHADLEALSLAPADHPCGIDVNAGSSKQSLTRGGQVLTGGDVDTTIMVEWGRHEFFDYGEDEDLLFQKSDREPLEAASADPWCVKREDIEGYLERLR